MTEVILQKKRVNMAFTRLFHLNIFLIYCVRGNTLEDLASHPGHLKPFGSQGKSIEVESLDDFPSPSVFFNEYVNASKPLLIRGGAKISPAFERWTDEYFLNIPEGKQHKVVVEQAKKENRTLSPEQLSFNEFMKRYREDDIYMVNPVPDFIGKDVYLPPSLLCPDVLEFLLDKVMWFSNGGTKSVLHYDSAENINCLFAGEKILYMIDYNKYSDKVTIENKKSAYSNVDVERVDLVKYPGLKDIEFHHVKMMPGDCLYIPYHWFHHVHSIGRNIAVNIWWSPSARPHIPACNLQNKTLDQVEFHGFGQLFPRETIDGIKDFIQQLFKLYENKVNLEQFRLYVTTHGVFEEDAAWSNEMIEMLDKTFNYLDEPSQDSLLTPDDLKMLPEQTWEKIILLFKELEKLVGDQFQQDDEEDDDFGPEDSQVEDEYDEHEKDEL